MTDISLLWQFCRTHYNDAYSGRSPLAEMSGYRAGEVSFAASNDGLCLHQQQVAALIVLSH